MRDFERDIIPMARRWGLAIAPWDVLAGGKIRTDAEGNVHRKTGEQGRQIFGQGWERNGQQKAIASAPEKIAVDVGARSIQTGNTSPPPF